MSDEPKMRTERGKQVWGLKKEIVAVLDPHPVELQMVALADTVAAVIANFQAADRKSTDDTHRAMLEAFISQTIRLIPLNEDHLLRSAQHNVQIKH